VAEPAIFGVEARRNAVEAESVEARMPSGMLAEVKARRTNGFSRGREALFS